MSGFQWENADQVQNGDLVYIKIGEPLRGRAEKVRRWADGAGPGQDIIVLEVRGHHLSLRPDSRIAIYR